MEKLNTVLNNKKWVADHIITEVDPFNNKYIVKNIFNSIYLRIYLTKEL